MKAWSQGENKTHWYCMWESSEIQVIDRMKGHDNRCAVTNDWMTAVWGAQVVAGVMVSRKNALKWELHYEWIVLVLRLKLPSAVDSWTGLPCEHTIRRVVREKKRADVLYRSV